MTVQPIILAAGRGKRMGNPDLPKVLTQLEGHAVIEYLLESVNRTGFQVPAIVIGFHGEMVRLALGDAYIYVIQEEQLGTGHAVTVCEPQLAGIAEAVLVMYGDQPLWSTATMQNLVAEHEKQEAVLSLATVSNDHPTFRSFGRIIRSENGEVVAIREQKDCTPEEEAILEVNPGLYCFSDAWLWSALKKIRTNNAQGEYYLTDLLGIAVEEGQKVASYSVEEWQETLGFNTPEQLEEVAKFF